MRRTASPRPTPRTFNALQVKLERAGFQSVRESIKQRAGWFRLFVRRRKKAA